MLSAGYIAGLFDGEGSLYYDRINKHYVVEIVNTNLEVLEMIREQLNMGRIFIDKRKEKKVYHLRIRKQSDVKRFVEMVKDECIIKRARIEEYLQWLNNTKMGVNSVTES